MKSVYCIATALLATSSSVAAYAPSDLKNELAGDVFQRPHWQPHFESEINGGVITSGNSTGFYREINGETLYLSYPRRNITKNTILYLTDIFGQQLVNNRLLADSLARAGYFVVLPDLFHGDPVPADALSNPNSDFNMTAWSLRHPTNATELVISHTLSTIREDFHAERIGAVGYCFGGRFVARHLVPGGGVDVGFTAHPSETTLDEWTAIDPSLPISVAFGAIDVLNPPENRSNIEATFTSGNKTFETRLYADAEHGFAVRTNLSVPLKALAQESAYWQAVRWFDVWIKGQQ